MAQDRPDILKNLTCIYDDRLLSVLFLQKIFPIQPVTWHVCWYSVSSGYQTDVGEWAEFFYKTNISYTHFALEFEVGF